MRLKRLILVLTLAVTAISCFEKPRRPVECELPTNYGGWVRVFFGKAGCTPNTSPAQTIVVVVGKDGTGCTSEAFEEGTARDSVFSRRSDGSKEELSRGERLFGQTIVRTTEKGKEVIFFEFFVGTKQEFAVTRRPSPLLE